MSHRPISTPGSDIEAWWASAVVYQIYPRSFADANGDGMGDLRGVTARLPYLKELGVDAVWLSPFYKSPQADAGYDVADYRQVDPMFGSLDDFDEMLQKAHGLGVKVIVDLVPNHTSDEHVWFREALAAEPGSAARERYIFRPGKDEVDGSGDGNIAPNNWKSIFGGPAWTRTTNADGTPGDWYLHLFDTKQPDLNWENPEVREEMRSVIRFWLDRGVDGFRVDVAHGMVKEAGLPDWDGVAAMVEGSADARHLPDAPGAHPESVEPHTAHHASLAAGSAGADDAARAKSPCWTLRERARSINRCPRCIRRRPSLTRTVSTTSTATGTVSWPSTTETACSWPKPGWNRRNGWHGISARTKCTRRSTSISCSPAGTPGAWR